VKLFLFGGEGSWWNQPIERQVDAVGERLGSVGIPVGQGEIDRRTLEPWLWRVADGSEEADGRWSPSTPPARVLTVRLPAVGDDGVEAAADALSAIGPDSMAVAVHEHIRLADGLARPAVSRVGLMARRPGSTLDEFWDHWTNGHMPLVLSRHPLFTRYVANRVLDARFGWDGVIEQWFDRVETLDEHDRRIRDEKPDVAADIPRFVGRMRHFVGEETASFPLGRAVGTAAGG
jgi:hypothetical protein